MLITIREIPPSLNRYAGWENCWQWRQDKAYWKKLVRLHCRKPDEPIRRARVEITYFFPDGRRRDPDNYNGKFILDGLTGAGILFDDSFGCIELTLRAGVDRKNPRTEIRIERMDG